MKTPTWIRSDRWLDRLVILGIAGVALWVSATVLASLAGRLDWLGLTRWGLPVCIDALAVYSVAKWINPRTPEAQRETARATAWSTTRVAGSGRYRAGPGSGDSGRAAVRRTTGACRCAAGAHRRSGTASSGSGPAGVGTVIRRSIGHADTVSFRRDSTPRRAASETTDAANDVGDVASSVGVVQRLARRYCQFQTDGSLGG